MPDTKEILDRLRRIETRLTRYLTDRGFDAQTQKPYYDADRGTLDVPSRKVSLQDCFEAMVPGAVATVMLESEPIGTLIKGVDL